MNKNSLVRYRYRLQDSVFPLRVQAVRVIDGARQLKVNGHWVDESQLVPNREWEEHKIKTFRGEE